MSEDVDAVCGAPLKTKDGRCERTPTQPDNRCKYHTESTGANNGEEEWTPEYRNGVYQSRGGYYKSLSHEDQQWVDAVTDDLINKSYYDKQDVSALEKCRQVAIDLHQRRRADEYVANKGMTQEQTVGFHEEYGEMTETQENTLFVTKDRLSRESRMTMKDLGILDKEKSETEEKAESLIESLSKDLS